jgi:hypothetical protein
MNPTALRNRNPFEFISSDLNQEKFSYSERGSLPHWNDGKR